MSNAHKEMNLYIQSIANKHFIEPERVKELYLDIIATVAKRDLPQEERSDAILKAVINEDGFTVYRLFKLVDTIENINNEMLFSEVGDEIVINHVDEDDQENQYAVEKLSFVMDRQKYNIIRQIAKQTFIQESKNNFVDNLLSRQPNLFRGKVKSKQGKNNFVIDVEGQDFLLPIAHLYNGEYLRFGDRILVSFEKAKNQYFLTRSSEQFISELVNNFVYETKHSNATVKSIARLPGFKTTICVYSPTQEMAVMPGVHSKLSRILNETVELVNYSEDIPTFIDNLLYGFNLTNISIDEDKNEIVVAIDDTHFKHKLQYREKQEQIMSAATCKTISLISQQQWNDESELNQQATIEWFSFALDTDRETARKLYENGFRYPEEIAYDVSPTIKGIDAADFNKLKNKALNMCLLSYSSLEESMVMAELGLQKEDLVTLFDSDIYTLGSLAELSSHELGEIIGNEDIDFCNAVILGARKKENII